MRNVALLATAACFLIAVVALSSLVAVSAPPTTAESSGLAFGVPIRLAAPVNPGEMQSQIVVYNPDTSGSATVGIRILNSSGNTQATIANFSVPANGAIVKPMPSDVPSPFSGSAVVWSDKQVQAVVTNSNTGYTARDSYASTGKPAATLSFPLVRHLAPDTANSIIAVQNTYSQPVDIALHLFDPAGGEVTERVASGVPSFASAYFDTNAIFPSGTFTGSAEATADGVALLAGAEQTRWQQDTASFRGLTSDDQGTTQLISYVLHTLSGGVPTYWNEIYVRNEGSSPTNVRAEYWNPSGTNTYSSTTSVEVPAGGLTSFADSAFSALGASWKGSVKLVSLDNQPLSVYSLQVSNSGVSLFGTEGVSMSQLGTRLVCGDYSKQSTGNSQLNILNPTGAAANVTVRLYNPTTGVQVASQSLTVGARSMTQLGAGSFGYAAVFEELALVTANVPLAVTVYTPYTVNNATAGVTSYACSPLEAGSAPAAFSKTSPANNANNVSLNPTLTWGAGSRAVNYEYCVSTTGGACSDKWIQTSKPSAPLSGLSPNTTYYWQVRAINGMGTTLANGSAWWSFTTQPNPAAFAKLTPSNGTSNQPPALSLTWQPSSGANSYSICYDNNNNGACDAPWIDVGNTTSYSSTFGIGKTYYWQVRAYNGSNFTLANGGWWSFKIQAAPGTFGKSSPANLATGQSVNPKLSWGASSGASAYEYCYYSTNPADCGGSWQPAGTSTSISLSGLAPNTPYYWQVRATNAISTTYANGTTWWRFTTQQLPGDFAKTGPANLATGLPASPTLTWGASARAASYEYCIDTTNNNTCDTSWVSTGTATSKALSGLASQTTYYWQVRARNVAGTTDASDGWRSFTTKTLPPVAFNKTNPANGLTGQPTTVSLNWASSAGADSYEYCVDPTNDGGCTSPATWISVGTNLTATIGPLKPGVSYYWQVRARNVAGVTVANGGWWSLATAPLPKPAAFAKLTPSNGATNQPTNVSLTWQPSSGAEYYIFCIDQTNNGSCDAGWTNNIGNVTTYAPPGLLAGKTYYWQVRAYNAAGFTPANSGTWWNFATSP